MQKESWEQEMGTWGSWGQEFGFIPLLTLLFMIKVLEKGVTRAGRGCNNIDPMDKMF